MFRRRPIGAPGWRRHSPKVLGFALDGGGHCGGSHWGWDGRVLGTALAATRPQGALAAGVPNTAYLLPLLAPAARALDRASLPGFPDAGPPPITEPRQVLSASAD